MNFIPYEEAKGLIKEGDILLFRGVGLIGFFIKRYTSGNHSHVAITHLDGDTWECVEFKEFMGGRSVALKGQVDANPTTIDVFRPLGKISYEELNDGVLSVVNKAYTEEVAKNTVRDIIKWTGQPYGWGNIWGMLIRFVPLVKLFMKQNTNDDELSKAKVCSTAVTIALRKNYMDPVPYLADDRVSPADLARSPLLQYLFTIEKDFKTGE
jgi:hypothetical protein